MERIKLLLAAAAVKGAARNAWTPETLKGTITTVDEGRRLPVATGADSVPFDMIVTPRTKIMSGNQAVAWKDMASYQNRNVSVKFVPERKGDVAERLDIGG
jgi:hypothetical protein